VDDGTLTIGQVAKRAGLNVSAIRYYEAEGILPQAERLAGQRRYTEETLTRLGVIDVAQRAGFSLDEIRALLTHADAGHPAHAQVRDLARRKLPEVEELIERAAAVRNWLEIATACGCDTLEVCGLFQSRDALPADGLRLITPRP
jgi:MerR family transcriptional regulator, redox-sensitive transcriptional activator SoxR